MLKKLYVELSSACNFNCKMCFRHNWFDEKIGLMLDEAVNVLKENIISGSFDTVFFGGMGEPLMHPRLPELVALATSCGKQTEIITNASLLTKEMSKELTKNGLSRLWVSMDGFSKESYEKIRRGSVFELIMKNLADFNTVRDDTQLGIGFVMMKENEHELKSINAFADSVAADILNLSHVVPGTPIEQTDVIYDKDYPIGKMKRFAESGGEKRLDYCPFIGDGVCFVRWDGNVFPCMQLLHNCYTYLYTERRKNYSKSFGNILERSLEDIWQSEDYTSFRKRVTDFEFPCCTVCLGCEDRLENLKDCMYNESPTCGACLWAQGIIRCP